MKIIAITQARCGSTRLPNKILKEINGKSLLELHLERIARSKLIDQVIVATTTEKQDDKVFDLVSAQNISCFRGSESNVLDRFYQAVQALPQKPDYIVRLTSDCPLIDSKLIDSVISLILNEKMDYVSNTLDETYPDGQCVEVFTYEALENAWKNAQLVSEKEHVTPYIWKNSTFKGSNLFSSQNLNEGYDMGHLRMTVDEEVDFEVIKRLVELKGNDADWLDYATLLEQDESIKKINQHISRNEGLIKSILNDKKISKNLGDLKIYCFIFGNIIDSLENMHFVFS